MTAFLAGQQIPAGPAFATVLPDMDFETYSEAGFPWNEATQKFDKPIGASKRGIFAVGAAVYTQHPTCEVLSFQFDLKDGRGAEFWRPGMPDPQRLFDYLAGGGLIEAHNSMFEYRVWMDVCRRLYGWPPIDQKQLRCSMAKARAHALPGSLDDLGRVLQIANQKDKEGTRLLNLFSIPRKPTAKDKRRRIRPEEDPVDGPKLYAYNKRDIVAESEVSVRCPDLPPYELKYWLADQAINYRGVGVDSRSVAACIDILHQAQAKYDKELYHLTGGTVPGASKVAQLKEWLADQGVYMDSMDADAIEEKLAELKDARGNMSIDVGPAIRALEIRQLVGSASVKKIYSMARMATRDHRLCDMFVYHGPRTGRDAHQDTQPGNLPKAGPKVRWCDDAGCSRPYAHALDVCPWCGCSSAFSRERFAPDEDGGWTWRAVQWALDVMAAGSLELVEWFFGDALLTISGCVRGMFVSAPGKDLICSDYSSIEAVVTAALAGEQWRLDAFARKDDIYLTSAARITGKSLEWYMENGGKKHPDRQKIGKPAELGLGFGGWIGAWRQFDSTDTFDDEQVKANIIAWREASPAIVELWGGQFRGTPWAPTRMELYGLEGCAVAAIQQPGKAFAYRGITYAVKDDVLYCRLLSGKLLTYHKPRLAKIRRRPEWCETMEITFEGWNTNPKKGPRGWIRMKTYGGSLAENVIQGTAADVMKFAVPNLEAAGYPIVLRIHDELAAEVPEGFGTIEEFETIMATLPDWCKDWPIRAAGGWRAKRYRKD
jgi:DNA polymerase